MGSFARFKHFKILYNEKIIGILGVAVIAATMFFNTNNASGSPSDISFAGLITMANAQSEGGKYTRYVSDDFPCRLRRVNHIFIGNSAN